MCGDRRAGHSWLITPQVKVGAMTPPAPPALTVRYDGSERTFAAGHDVVVGRDLRADMRITHPLISRAHLLLRFDQGRWLAIDNGSLNGTFVNGRRVPVVDIQDGQSINIGNPDGPALRFKESGGARRDGWAPTPNRVDAHRPGLRNGVAQLSGIRSAGAPDRRSPGLASGPPGRSPMWAGPPPLRPHPGPPGQPVYPAGGAPPRPGAHPPSAPPPANFQPHPQMSGVGVGAPNSAPQTQSHQRRQARRDVGVEPGDQDVSGVAAVPLRSDAQAGRLCDDRPCHR